MTSNWSATRAESPPTAPASEPVVTAASERRLRAVAFVEAAVDLAGATLDAEARPRVAEAAARALVRLGELGERAALAEVLRPDPADEDTVWTVACYQIGDLVPCSLLDFTNPVRAVAALASCDEASHVAAELLASTASGLRWAAVVRMGDRVVYQPLDEESAAAGVTESEELASALGAWEARLHEWNGLVGVGAEVLGIGLEPDPLPEVTGGDAGAVLAQLLAAVRSVDARIQAGDELLAQMHERLGAIERRMARVERAVDSDPTGRHLAPARSRQVAGPGGDAAPR